MLNAPPKMVHRSTKLYPLPAKSKSFTSVTDTEHRNKALFVCFKTGDQNPDPRLFTDPQIEGITH